MPNSRVETKLCSFRLDIDVDYHGLRVGKDVWPAKLKLWLREVPACGMGTFNSLKLARDKGDRPHKRGYKSKYPSTAPGVASEESGVGGEDGEDGDAMCNWATGILDADATRIVSAGVAIWPMPEPWRM